MHSRTQVRLEEAAIAATYIYIPSNLPLAKGGYKHPLADLSCSGQGCTKSTIPVIISSLRHAINLAQIEKLRDRRSSLEEATTNTVIYY